MNRLDNRQSFGRVHAIMGTISLVWCLAAAAVAADPLIRSDMANAVAFPTQQARFVRFVIHASSASQPCIDELEVYAPDGKRNLALAKHQAKATASSCLAGHRQHTIEHLNDGRYGNEYSWIAAGASDEWAQIELPKATEVSKVVFSRDRMRQYADRVPIEFEVRLSMDGKTWSTVKKVASKAAPVVLRRGPVGFAGYVPNPPPPPKRTRQGVLVTLTEPRDVKVPRLLDMDAP